jgi:hypothetical protein
MKLYILKSKYEAELIFGEFHKKGWSYDLECGDTNKTAEDFFDNYPVLNFSLAKQHISGYTKEANPVKKAASTDFLDLSQVFDILNSKENVVLNDKYTAVVGSDGSVEVGCQTFSAEVILKLAEVVKKKL